MLKILLSATLTLAWCGTATLSAQSEADERRVSYQTEEEADKAMNATYKVILSRLTGKEREAFVKAQRAWVSWRDAESESDTIDWIMTNNHGRFMADSKRAMTIDRLATFMKVEANTRPAIKSGP